MLFNSCQPKALLCDFCAIYCLEKKGLGRRFNLREGETSLISDKNMGLKLLLTEYLLCAGGIR